MFNASLNHSASYPRSPKCQSTPSKLPSSARAPMQSADLSHSNKEGEWAPLAVTDSVQLGSADQAATPHLFHAHAGRCSMGLEIGWVDNGLYLTVVSRQAHHHLREDTFVTAPVPTIAKCLMWAILFWRSRHRNPLRLMKIIRLINARLAMELREIGIRTRHLRVVQPEKIRHVTAQFSNRDSLRPIEINRSLAKPLVKIIAQQNFYPILFS